MFGDYFKAFGLGDLPDMNQQAPQPQNSAASLQSTLANPGVAAAQGASGPVAPHPITQTWPAQVAGGLWNAVTLPGDVLSGQTTPQSPDYIERTTNLAAIPAVGGTGAFGRAAPSAAVAPAPQGFDWRAFAGDLARQTSERPPLTAKQRAGITAQDLRRSVGARGRLPGDDQTDAALKSIKEALEVRSPLGGR